MNTKKQLRIFVDCHVFDGKFQGTRTYLQGLYTELIKDKGFHFFLAAKDITNLAAIFGNHSNVTYVAYKSESKIYRLLIDSPKLIKKNKIDFAHFQYRVPPFKFCYYINTVHDVLFEDFPEYFSPLRRRIDFIAYKLSGKASEIVLTVSEYSKNSIKKHLGIPNAYITTNGISEVFFEEYDKTVLQQEIKEKYGINNYLIYTSRWEPRKNHDLLLKTFVELELYKNHTLVFIGDVSDPNKAYDEYYGNLSSEVKEKVVNLGRVNFQEMLLLLRGAKLFVYPSAAEGFGIPPLEAIAANVPVISSGRTAMSDFDFIGKYLFDPYNEEEFKAILVKAVESYDYEALNSMREAVKNRYNWQQSAIAYKQSVTAFLDEKA